MRIVAAISYALLAAVSLFTFHSAPEPMPILVVLACAAVISALQALLYDRITYRAAGILLGFWSVVAMVSVLFVGYYVLFNIERPYFIPLATMFIALIGASESANLLHTYRELAKRVLDEAA
jgi:hypothetical protein